MPSLKIRLELNRGRVGIPLEKLANIAKDTKAFLTMLGTDLHLSSEDWIANNFANGSVMFDCQRIALDAASQEKGHRAMRAIFSGDRESEINALIRPATRLQYSLIGKQIDADEVIRIGLYQNGGREPGDWYELTREIAEEISESNARFAQYYGEVQGIVHAFFKEARKPKLVIRELSSQTLIDCFFKREMYHAAVDTMTEPGAVIFVEGTINEDLGIGVVESIEVTDFRLAPDFDLAFFDSFIGSQPNATGVLTSEEFTERINTDG